ncbi:MAG: cobalamin biosynthesis protein [Sulfolobaceae archaeon]|nr:cobalamin biosynthesis protein [Sulfolobales archaeon]
MNLFDWPRGIAVISTSEGREVAEKIAKALPNAYLLGGYSRDALDEAFACYSGIVLVMSLGGAVRLVCERMSEKGEGPAVVVVDPLGKFAIPLINSHWGANELAQTISEKLGSIAVITTVAERKGMRPLENLARLLYGEFQPKELIAKYYSRILRGEKACAVGFDVPEGFDYLEKGEGCELRIYYGNCKEGHLCVKPYRLYIGIGAKREAHSLRDGVLRVLDELRVPRERVKAVGSVRKEAEEVAKALGTEFRLFSFDEIRQFDHECLSPGSETLSSLGLQGVAEAVALLMAGPRGKLLIRKVREKEFTVAVAGAVEG